MKSVIYTTGGAADGSGGEGHERLSGRSILLGGAGGLKNSVCVCRPDIWGLGLMRMEKEATCLSSSLDEGCK